MPVQTGQPPTDVPRRSRERHGRDRRRVGGGGRRPRRRNDPRTAVRTVIAALLLGALVNGPGLVSAATGLEVGPVRTVSLAVASGVERTAQVLGLDRPRRWMVQARDGEVGTALGAADRDDAGRRVGEDRRNDGPASDRADTEPRESGPRADRSTDAPGAPTRADDLAPARPITTDDPLGVLLIGDSLIGSIAEGFGRLYSDSDLVDWHADVRISTGLARPDVLDWHAHLERQLAAHDPDVVVIMIGGNDDQSLIGAEAGVIHYGQEGWEAEYERRVARLLDAASGDERMVIWLQLPAMQPSRLEEARQRMNAAAGRAAAGTGVVLLDTTTLISPDGFASRMDGTQVRAADGVHLTHPGGDLVAGSLDEMIRTRYELDGEG